MEIMLRPVREEDLDAFETERATPELRGEFQWYGHRSPHALRREFAENGLLGSGSGRLTIDVNGDPAGWVVWWMTSWGPDSTCWCWALGICVFSGFRGKGVGTRAQGELVDYLFAHTRAERVQAFTDVANHGERRALEKAGFECEGILRRAQWRDGRWHDQALYSVLRPDR
ncbi:GNAT family N-acetyltransferase [Streptosporangium sp. NPDC004379]|uniref:GNAT family N-acetyltransferase n=1 Tax=Streptosporangium sp. NPDC004379 TaxID=3366189 RepID=UPI0036A1E25E